MDFLRIKSLRLYLILTIILAIGIGLRVYNLESAPRVFFDEGVYGDVSKNFADGFFMIQEHKIYGRSQAFFDHFPLYFIITGGVFKVFGEGIVQARMVSVVFSFGTLILIYLLGRTMYDKKVGIIAVFIGILERSMLRTNRKAMLDTTEAFFLTFALLLWWLGVKRDSKRLIVISGIVGGLAVLSKVLGIISLPILLLFCLLSVRSQKGKTSSYLRSFLIFAITLAATITPYVLWALMTNPSEFIADNVAVFSKPYTFTPFVFAQNWFRMLQGDPLGYLLGIFGFLAVIRSRRLNDMFMASWFLVPALTLFWIRGMSEWYLMPMMPTIFILGSNLLVGFWEGRLLSPLARQLRSKRVRLLSIVSVLLLFTAFHAYVDIRLITMPDSTPQQLASYIDENVEKNKLILGSWEIDFLSKEHTLYEITFYGYDPIQDKNVSRLLTSEIMIKLGVDYTLVRDTDFEKAGAEEFQAFLEQYAEPIIIIGDTTIYKFDLGELRTLD